MSLIKEAHTPVLVILGNRMNHEYLEKQAAIVNGKIVFSQNVEQINDMCSSDLLIIAVEERIDDNSGYIYARELKRKFKQNPVYVLISRQTSYEIIKCREYGIDGFFKTGVHYFDIMKSSLKFFMNVNSV